MGKNYKFIISALISILPQFIFAQNQLIPSSNLQDFSLILEADTNKSIYQKSHFSINGAYLFNSTGLNSSFGNAFGFGGFIDKEIKENNLNQMPNRFKAFSNYHYEINFLAGRERLIKNEHLFRWGFRISREDYLDGESNKEFFRFLTEGNAPFAGQWIRGEKITIQSMRYDRFMFELQGRKKTKISFLGESGNLYYGAALGLVLGERFSRLELNRFNLFTEEAGTYIDLEVDGNLSRTPPLNRGEIKINAAGAAIDFNMGFMGQKQQINLRVRNLGFMRFGNNFTEYSADASIRFEGLKYSSGSEFNFDGLTDSLINQLNADSIKGGKTQMLPLQLAINYAYKLNDRSQINFEIGTRLFYLPTIFFAANYMRRSGTILYYGGLSTGNMDLYNINAGIIIPIKNIIQIQGHVTGIESLISPETMRGFGVRVGVVLSPNF